MDPKKTDTSEEKTEIKSGQSTMYIVRNLPRVKECLEQYTGERKMTIINHLVNLYKNSGENSSIVEILAQVLPLYGDDAVDLVKELTDWGTIDEGGRYNDYERSDREEITEKIIRIYQLFANKKIITWYQRYRKEKNPENHLETVFVLACHLDFSYEVIEAIVNTALKYKNDKDVIDTIWGFDNMDTAEELIRYAKILGNDVVVDIYENYPELYILETP